MLIVKPVARNEGQEELGAVRVWTCIGHREIASASVLNLEVLVGEFLTVDRLTSCSVASSEVTTLSHEFIDDTMECGALVVKWLATLSDSLLSSAEGSEVLSGLWGLVSVELHGDSTSVLTSDGHVEENMWV